ncbi:MAG TPA: hypothetical protein VKY22_25200 [Bradyrhizobium sp.]|jgi:hypothetical protein|nr:hypothetical protein [Bradyrhizobium sp.]
MPIAAGTFLGLRERPWPRVVALSRSFKALDLLASTSHAAGVCCNKADRATLQRFFSSQESPE